MPALTHHVSLEVSCPVCPESYRVPLHAIEESQRLLDETGPCSGMASYECPAPYLAELAPPAAISRLSRAAADFEVEVGRRGCGVLWDDTTADPAPPIEPAALEQIAEVIRRSARRARRSDFEPNRDAASSTPELARWENEGGACGRV